MSERTEQDRVLLARYAREGSESAFRELVQRNVDLVWGAAWRVTEDADLARDVAQTVFSDLARKAKFFPAGASVAGWLYRAAVMTARNLRRTNERRTRREREAMETHFAIHADESESARVDKLMPLLDEGLQTLPTKDRDAIVLRFFARKSLAEVGTALALSEDAAQKRVSRALERLKLFFAAKGQVVGAGAVLATLGSAGSMAAPAGVAATVTGASCGSLAAAGWTNTVGSFLAGAGEQIVIMKTKIMVASLATVAVSVPLVIQQQSLAALQRERSAMEVAVADMEKLRAQAAQFGAQAQLANDLAQFQKELAELNQLREEARRLQAVAAANPEQQRRLAEARKNHEIARAAAQAELDIVEGEKVRIETINTMKHMGLAARIFATDNQDKFPKTFEEIENELGGKGMLEKLRIDRFEFMPHEREISEADPQMILFREKEPRRTPEGKWTKAYTLADGSVQNITMDTPDFSEWEKQYTAKLEQRASK